MQSATQFKIQGLRQQSQGAMVEALAIMMFALFLTAFLPQILIRFLYADQQLMSEPMLLQYIPIATFVLGVLGFLMAFFGNWRRRGEIRRLEKELSSMSMMDCCSGCDDACACDDHGNCECGSCDVDGKNMMKAEVGTTNDMATQMSALNKRKKSSKRK